MRWEDLNDVNLGRVSVLEVGVGEPVWYWRPVARVVPHGDGYRVELWTLDDERRWQPVAVSDEDGRPVVWPTRYGARKAAELEVAARPERAVQ